MVIQVFASWCEQCRTLKPFFENIANQFASLPSPEVVKVMAIDGTQVNVLLDEGKLYM